MALKTQQGIIIYSKNILEGENLQALIQKITPEYMTIDIPINNITIEKGTELFINFWDEQATYEFQSKVLTFKSTSESTINITRPTTLKKIFNRTYPRIVLKTPAAIYDYEGINRVQCIIIDISAGGTMVTAKAGRKNGDIIKLAFTLPNNELFEDVVGKIMWVKSINEVISKYGIEFQLFSEIRRKKIIKFINNELAKQHK